MATKSITTQALISTESGTELAPSATDFSPLITEWHAALDRRVAAGELAPATRSAYTIGAAKFIVWAQTQLIAAVTRDTIRDWIAALRIAGHKPGSINTWLSGLRAFYAWALAEHRLTSDPTVGLKGAKRKGTTRQHKRAALTDREVVRVLRQPDTGTPHRYSRQGHPGADGLHGGAHHRGAAGRPGRSEERGRANGAPRAGQRPRRKRRIDRDR